MITKCRSCQSENLTPVLSLGDQCLSDFVSGDEKSEKFPLNLVLCKNCTLVQLRETTPPGKLYNDHYGYKSGINDTMKKELSCIVSEAIKRLDLNSGDIVLSIGENDGTLLSYCPDYVIKIGVEPISKLAKQCEKHADFVINDFWSYESYEREVTEEKLSNLRKRNNP